MNEDNDNTSAWLGFAGQMATATINAADSRAGRKWQEARMAEDRAWQEEMYQRQLDDSINWRTHQEQYNSPEAQMQRYKDAGINPMYAVTGNGGNSVTQPFTASSGGFKSSTPTPYGKNYQLDFGQMVALKNQTKIADAQAADYQASARFKNAEAAQREFENGVNAALLEMDFGNGKNYHQMQAEVKAAALRYQSEFQGLQFEDQKNAFLHNAAVRKFTESLHPMQKEKFEHEVKSARNASEIAQIRKNWEKTNQWIGAGTDILGALAALIGSTKGMGFNPINTRSETPFVQERHYYGDTNINNN